MTSHKEWLSELKRVTTGVQCGAGQVIVSEGMGKVSLSVKNDKGDTADVTLCDVLYIPTMKVNLLSTTRTAVYGGATVIQEGTEIHIKSNGIDSDTLIIGRFTEQQQLYVLDCSANPSEPQEDKCFAASETVVVNIPN